MQYNHIQTNQKHPSSPPYLINLHIFMTIFLFSTLPRSLSQNIQQEAKTIKLITLKHLPIAEQSYMYYEQQWKKFKNALRDPNIGINGIRVIDNVVTVSGIKMLMGMGLQNITCLIFQDTTFNSQTFNQLISHQHLYTSLQQLQLINCNIFDQDLQHLPIRQTKLKILNLANNIISIDGFKYLTRLHMNLTSLDLTGTSLISDDAVDAVIQFGLRYVEIVNLCDTGVSGRNLLRLLGEMDLGRLRVLQICTNTFQQQFYKTLSTLQFPSLTALNLNNLNIQQNFFKYFHNISTPSLTQLQLKQNQLTTEQGIKLFKKNRFPSLKTLYIDENFINSTFLEYIVKEDIMLERVSVKVQKIGREGLKWVGKIGGGGLREVRYSARSTMPEVMVCFINQNQFNLLEILELGQMQNTGDYFKHILDKKWPKLKTLTLPSIQSLPSQPPIKPPFPLLQSLTITLLIPDQEQIQNFIINIQKYAPKLKNLNIDGPVLVGIYYQLINGMFLYSKKANITIKLHSYFPVQNVFRFVISNYSKPKILEIDLGNLFQTYIVANIDKMTKNKTFTPDISHTIDIINYANNLLKFLLNNFQLTQLQTLNQASLLQLHQNLLKRTQTPPSYIFKRLKILQINIVSITNIAIIHQFQYPLLKSLILGTAEDKLEQIGNFSFSGMDNKFVYLNQFVTDLVVEKECFMGFFRGNLMGGLKIIHLLEVRNIKSEDLLEIQRLIPYPQRIRIFKFNQVFINNNLTFLTSSIRPQILLFQNILFNPGVILQLCSINFQFITQLQLSFTGLNDNNILDLLQCLQKKQQQKAIKYNRTWDGELNFPKLKKLILSNNYLGGQAMQRIMGIKMPLLGIVDFDNNVNAQIFNSVFRSVWSKRIYNFEIKQKNYGEIDSSIDPTNTRKLKNLVINNSDMLQPDIQAISNLDFYSLQTLQLKLTKLQNCQTLKSILRLTKNIIQIKLSISNSPSISSSCLSSQLLQPQYKSWIKPQVLFLKGNEYYGQISNLASLLIERGQQWRSLQMASSSLMFQNKIVQILENVDFRLMNQFVFRRCGLDDHFLDVIVEGVKARGYKFGEFYQVVLSGNQITGKGFGRFLGAGGNWSKLIHLKLDETDIGDQGLYHLSKIQLPLLTDLDLSNINMTRQGLIYLSQLHAPNLKLLDISSNSLSFEDLLYLNPQYLQSIHTIYIYPELNRQEYQELLQKYTILKPQTIYQIQSHIHLITTIIQPNLLDQQINVEFYSGYYDDQVRQGQEEQQDEDEEEEGIQ